jgi:hypothetical protein
MMQLKVMSLVFFLCFLPYSVVAVTFDGSEPLLCAAVDVFECGSGEACQRSSVEIANVPQFIKINFAKKTASTVGKDSRTASIQNLQRLAGRIVMQGVGDNGRGWSLVISEESGKMAAAVADDQVAFVVFGACTAP